MALQMTLGSTEACSLGQTAPWPNVWTTVLGIKLQVGNEEQNLPDAHTIDQNTIFWLPCYDHALWSDKELILINFRGD